MSETPSRVLVVDDDAGGRYVKVHVLRRAGYEVFEADTGEAAIACCARDMPALVVLDMRLPGISGMVVCRRIKAAHPQIMVLQTSAALTGAQDRALGLDGGADTFLVEPIEPEELLATVRALLRVRRAEQELRRVNERLEDLLTERTEELATANRRLAVEIGEREKAEEVLRHTQKMEAIGQLTGGIAHDFNNILAVIIGSLGMVRSAVEGKRQYAQEKLVRLLDAAETAADRGAKMTHQLLAFARRTVLSSQVVVVDEVLAGCEFFLRRALGETVKLEMSGPPDLWPCQLDPVQFESAILNLSVNARDAMPLGGVLKIVTENVELGAQAPGQDMVPPGEYVRVRLTDTGTGMNPDIVKHIFEPFFTTKEVGQGTGLGLSQVYGFVTQSGGFIAVETALGVGSTFTIHLPRATPIEAGLQDDPDEVAAGIVGAPLDNKTILVVEDHPEVRELAMITIADLGYHVLWAADGPAALEVLRGNAPVDLLFSDVVMPGGINGFELVRRARILRRGIKALITTGYAAIRDQEALVETTVLAKPYTRVELARRLHDALGAA